MNPPLPQAEDQTDRRPAPHGAGTTTKRLASALLVLLVSLFAAGCADQDDPTDLLSLAASAIATGDARTAARHYRDAAAISPDDSFIRWQLAKTLLMIRDGSGAETQILAATQLGVDQERTQPALAHALFLQGKYDQVLALSAEGLGKLATANVLAYQVRAWIETGDLEAAQDLLARAAKLSRYSADVFFAQAELALARDERQEAIEALHNVRLLERAYPYAAARQGQLALEQGDAETAERYFSEAVELRYGPWPDRLNRGVARLRQGKHEQARQDMQALLALAPEESGVQLFSYQAHALSKDMPQARAALEQVLEQHPDLASAHLALARMELHAGNIPGAESSARAALAAQAAYVPARKLLALLLLEQDRPNEALEIIQPALETSPDDPQVERIIAYGYLKAERYDDLADLAQRLQKNLSEGVYEQFSRGLGMLGTGELTTGGRLIEPAVAMTSGDLEPFDPFEVTLDARPGQLQTAQTEIIDPEKSVVAHHLPPTQTADADDRLTPSGDPVERPPEPATVIDQPRITGIEPALVSVELLPPEPPTVMPEVGETDAAALAAQEPETQAEARPTAETIADPVAETKVEPVDTAGTDQIAAARAAEMITDQVAPKQAEPVTPVTGADKYADQDTATDSGERGISAAEIKAFVDSWADAWSRQDVSAYLTHYADSFRPADGTDRATWEAQRQERLTRPRSISVQIDDFELTPMDADHVQVQFVQRYRANHYRDRVTKTLFLMRMDDAWRIVGEVSG